MPTMPTMVCLCWQVIADMYCITVQVPTQFFDSSYFYDSAIPTPSAGRQLYRHIDVSAHTSPTGRSFSRNVLICTGSFEEVDRTYVHDDRGRISELFDLRGDILRSFRATVVIAGKTLTPGKILTVYVAASEALRMKKEAEITGLQWQHMYIGSSDGPPVRYKCFAAMITHSGRAAYWDHGLGVLWFSKDADLMGFRRRKELFFNGQLLYYAENAPGFDCNDPFNGPAKWRMCAANEIDVMPENMKRDYARFLGAKHAGHLKMYVELERFAYLFEELEVEVETEVAPQDDGEEVVVLEASAVNALSTLGDLNVDDDSDFDDLTEIYENLCYLTNEARKVVVLAEEEWWNAQQDLADAKKNVHRANASYARQAKDDLERAEKHFAEMNRELAKATDALAKADKKADDAFRMLSGREPSNKRKTIEEVYAASGLGYGRKQKKLDVNEWPASYHTEGAHTRSRRSKEATVLAACSKGYA